MQKAREDLDRFNQRDKPLHTRWVASTFGARLTELRELHAKLEALRSLVERVEAEYMFGDHRSVYQAFREVKREDERQASAPDDAGESQAGEEDRDSSDEEEREFREAFESEARRFFSEAFGFDPGNLFGDAPEEPSEQPVDGRLKELYRAIVRRLHPDTGGERTSAQMELWHQAQHAYEEKDANQLEVILATLEVEENGVASSSVSVLQKIVAQFRSGLRSIQTLLKQARRDPAWNFSKLKDTAALARHMERLLDSDKRMMLAQLTELETQVRIWEDGASRPSRKVNSRNRRQKRPMGCPF